MCVNPVLDSIPSAPCVLLIRSSRLCEAGAIVPILQRRKLRHREVKGPSQGHTAACMKHFPRAQHRVDAQKTVVLVIIDILIWEKLRRVWGWGCPSLSLVGWCHWKYTTLPSSESSVQPG